MPQLRILFGLVALALFGGLLLGDDVKKTGDAKSDSTPKVSHQLPSGWKQLGLSDAQKKKVYAIRDEYGTKIAALKKQLEDLQHEEHAKMYDVLTAEQKTQLKALREIKDSGGSKDDKKDDKKDVKKEEKKP
jgi:Spy/CpxP family protein refolding chaperone